MKSKIWTLFCIVTFGLVGQQAQAGLNFKKEQAEHGETMVVTSACKALVSLEDKEELDFNEELVWLVAHDIIEQISVSPLDYCEIMAAKITEKDPFEK